MAPTLGDDDSFDSFWDLATMLDHGHQKKDHDHSSPSLIRSRFDGGVRARIAPPSELSEICLYEQQSDTDHEPSETSLSSIERPWQEECYQPKDTGLLTYVRVIRYHNSYSFYAKFREDAAKYYFEKGVRCDPVPFFSYIPQYSQMNAEQKEFYFYWRDRVREKEYLSCDISYVWLYIYEIINLPDVLEPEKGARMLAEIWGAYRKKYPKIDKYMAVWLADYCLVHRQPCPIDLLSSFLPDILANAGFKEFYLGETTGDDDQVVLSVLSLASEYPWQKSKFSQDHMLRALGPVVRDVMQKGDLLSSSDKISILSREAFSGSLCAHNIKCHIEVGYRSLEHSPTLNVIITACVKYAENRLRALGGQKSRLSVGEALPARYAELIDEYFAPLFEKKVTATNAIPIYEKQYDAPATEIDFSDVRKIEALSWKNTQKLLPEEEASALYSDDKEKEPVSDDANGVLAETQQEQENKPLGDDERRLLTQLLAGEVVASLEILQTAEKINMRSNVIIGDIMIDIREDKCSLITEYREDALQWLNKM